MQISDFLMEYGRNQTQLTQDLQIPGLLKEIAKEQTTTLLNMLGNTSKGEIIEGKILDISPKQVLVELEQGHKFKAKLETQLTFEKGDMIAFQVKDVKGQRIEIKPVDMESYVPSKIQQALKESNLPITKENIKLVDEFMKHKLPVDKGTLVEAKSVLTSHPNMKVSDLIFLKQADVPLKAEFLKLYETFFMEKEDWTSPVAKDLKELQQAFSFKEAEGQEQIETVVKQMKEQLALKPQEFQNKELVKEFFQSFEEKVETLKEQLVKETIIKRPEELQVSKEEGKEVVVPKEIISEKQEAVKSLVQSLDQAKETVGQMGKLNEFLPFVQIPVLMNQNMKQADLYVYKRGKSHEQKDEISAFLHLDMDALGVVDVAVKLKEKQLHTDFYLEDEASFTLIQEHIYELQEALSKLGFQCEIQVTMDHEEKAGLVKFLKEETRDVEVKRYSFDARA